MENKYIKCKEIESLGWIKVNVRCINPKTLYFKKEGYEMTKIDNTITIVEFKNKLDIVFRGKLKDSKELVNLMKEIGIL